MKTKSLNFTECKVKFDENSEKMLFSGYASVFGGVDSYGDTIHEKAYDETLKNRERPIRMRWNHYGPVIGKWTKFEVDHKGLFVEGELTPGHSVAEDVYSSLKHGAVDGMSIGYRVKDYEDLGNGRTLLKEIDLIEISVVEEPADGSALVANVKAKIDDCNSLKDAENLLRDASNLSKSEATALVSRIKAIVQSDSEKVQKEMGDIFNNFFKD